uniref:Uncharacterized protein n=1 Tax=Cannabis sativa TaxID=3483 RepID=A0A803P2Y1_CANSA
MEADDEERRKERVVLAAIVVFASIAVASLLVALSYYCYIRNKVTRLGKKNRSSEPHLILNPLFGSKGTATESMKLF